MCNPTGEAGLPTYAVNLLGSLEVPYVISHLQGVSADRGLGMGEPRTRRTSMLKSVCPGNSLSRSLWRLAFLRYRLVTFCASCAMAGRRPSVLACNSRLCLLWCPSRLCKGTWSRGIVYTNSAVGAVVWEEAGHETQRCTCLRESPQSGRPRHRACDASLTARQRRGSPSVIS